MNGLTRRGQESRHSPLKELSPPPPHRRRPATPLAPNTGMICALQRDTSPHQDSAGTAPSGTLPPACAVNNVFPYPIFFTDTVIWIYINTCIERDDASLQQQLAASEVSLGDKHTILIFFFFHRPCSEPSRTPSPLLKRKSTRPLDGWRQREREKKTLSRRRERRERRCVIFVYLFICVCMYSYSFIYIYMYIYVYIYICVCIYEECII